MATWTQISWDKVLYMLENGVDKCNLNHNILYVECQTSRMHGKPRRLFNQRLYTKEPKFNHLDKLEEYKDFVDTEIDEKGLILRPSNKYFEYIKAKMKIDSMKRPSLLKTSRRIKTSRLKSTNATYFSLTDYANLGYSLVSSDINNDGFDDLIIGSPVFSEKNTHQNGAVFIVLANPKTGTVPMSDLNIEKAADLVIKPPKDSVRARFGHSVAVLDLNLDGYKDIVISAPSYGLRDLQYQGRVFIYFGDKTFRYEKPQLNITCKNFKYCNLGWSLTTGTVDEDDNADLIMGSPYASTCGDQCGFVAVLLSHNQSFMPEMDVSNLDWFSSGNMSYESFGHSISVKKGLLVVGAPQSRLCSRPNCAFVQEDVQSVGRVYVYQYPFESPIGTIRGVTEYEQLGYSCDLSLYQNKRIVLAVGSPSKDTKRNYAFGADLSRAGIVQLFELNTALKNLTLIATLKSDRAYSGFGSKVKFYSPFGDANEDLYVGAHLRSEDITLLGQIEDGIVYRFSGGQNLPSGNFTDDCDLDIYPCPQKKALTIFSLGERKSQFGYDFTFLKTLNKVEINIAISSIHASFTGNNRLSGKIDIFNFNL